MYTVQPLGVYRAAHLQLCSWEMMQESRYAGKLRGRKEGMQDMMDAEHEGCGTGRMQYRKDAG